jgi:hypothetical protein
MQPLTDGSMQPGPRIRLSFGRSPLHAPLDLEVTRLEPERALSYMTVSRGGIQWEGGVSTHRCLSGSPLGWHSAELRFTGLWRLLEPMVVAEITHGEIAELERLKTVSRCPLAGSPRERRWRAAFLSRSGRRS